jgi:tetratricopeptide (TPR) repeat protein
MLWPAGLAAFYPFAIRDVVASKVLLSLVLLILISTVVFLLRRRRYLVTGWLWYLIMLGPVIGILQVGSQARADRYTYLPQIGLSILVTWAAVDLCARWRHRRLFLGPLSIMIVVVLILSARTQASYWKDSETLWRLARSRTRDNVMAELNLGEALYKLGRTSEAIGHFDRALQINSNQASAHSSLGVALLEIGQAHRALIHFQKAIEIHPRSADAHYNLGNGFLQIGRASEALAHYQKALEITPDDTETLNNMAWILATWPEALTRDGTKAVELAERADSLTRGASPVISATLGAAYAEAGRFEDATRAAQRALQLALAEGNEARAASIREQLEFYQAGRAFRDRRSLR